MSEERKWPKRGTFSADGKLVTDADGTVYEAREGDHSWDYVKCAVCKHSGRGCSAQLHESCAWRLIEFSYVPSDEELLTCVMVREAIEMCASREDGGCAECGYTENCDNPCVLRHYLCRMRQPDAWEVGA